jgi:hypothetical protein
MFADAERCILSELCRWRGVRIWRWDGEELLSFLLYKASKLSLQDGEETAALPQVIHS